METIPFFRALLFARCMMYSIYRIINEKFKTRAIEPCKSEALTLYHSGDTRWRNNLLLDVDDCACSSVYLYFCLDG